jgi:hypothetical protein
MRPLTASHLLQVWEQGMNRPPVQQALLLLAAALPDLSLAVLAELSIGRRDAHLLDLRQQLFGPQLASVVACPVCDQKLEFTCQISDIRMQEVAEPPDTFTWRGQDYEACFRLPNSLDITAVGGEEVRQSQTTTAEDEAAHIKQQLLARCLISASCGHETVSADELPPTIVEQIVARMAQADPQADVQLALSCAACGHHWSAVFDILAFLWAEITAWAYRTLHEVHRLAAAYSWREADILALSAWRRQYYLNLVHA